MSPRAAWRLETLGFQRVYDYTAGKSDWFAAGLPREGRASGTPRTADLARKTDVTCLLDERVGEVAQRVREGGESAAVVVNEERVVLGLLREKHLAGDASGVAEAVMQAGPTTLRPDAEIEAVFARMSKRDVEAVLVTNSDGRLVGSLYRADLEERPSSPGKEAGPSCDCE